MTDDQKSLAAELDQLSTHAARLAERVRRLGRAGDGIDDLREGFFLTVRQAATICELTDQAIRNWIDDAARMRRPIAEKRASVWVIDTARLLTFIEKHRGGPSARTTAENQLKEYWPIWSQELSVDVKKRAAG